MNEAEEDGAKARGSQDQGLQGDLAVFVPVEGLCQGQDLRN